MMKTIGANNFKKVPQELFDEDELHCARELLRDRPPGPFTVRDFYGLFWPGMKSKPKLGQRSSQPSTQACCPWIALIETRLQSGTDTFRPTTV